MKFEPQYLDASQCNVVFHSEYANQINPVYHGKCADQKENVSHIGNVSQDATETHRSGAKAIIKLCTKRKLRANVNTKPIKKLRSQNKILTHSDNASPVEFVSHIINVSHVNGVIQNNPASHINIVSHRTNARFYHEM